MVSSHWTVSTLGTSNMWLIFYFIFVFVMFYWMYSVLQTWYNDQKTTLTPSIQSEDSSNYVLKMMWKSIKSSKSQKISRNFFDWFCGTKSPRANFLLFFENAQNLNFQTSDGQTKKLTASLHSSKLSSQTVWQSDENWSLYRLKCARPPP